MANIYQNPIVDELMVRFNKCEVALRLDPANLRAQGQRQAYSEMYDWCITNQIEILNAS